LRQDTLNLLKIIPNQGIRGRHARRGLLKRWLQQLAHGIAR